MKSKLALLKGRLTGAHDIKFRASLQSEDLLIEVYGDIGESFFGDGITASQIAEALKTESGSVTVRINSPGGDAFEGVAIYNLLKSSGRPVNVIVDGLAASAASIIAMAGERISMGEGTMMMIHPAFVLAYGNSVDMREIAAVLEKASGNMADIYAARSGQPRDSVLEMMYAETWMNPEDAIKMGFATDMVKAASKAGDVAAAYDLAVYSNAPQQLLAKKEETTPEAIGTPLADLALRELELYGETAR